MITFEFIDFMRLFLLKYLAKPYLSMLFCENCGNKVSDQTKFCAKCGTKLNQEVADNPIQNVLPNHQKHIPNKKSGFLKYLLILAVAVIALIYFKGNAENNYDSAGYKHGDWVEYINEDGSQEVPKEFAKYIRQITYSHGMSLALVKDYYPSGNIQSEFHLISGLYKKNEDRPKDEFIGYAVFFDEQTSKINGFAYFDDNGEINLEKTLGLAYEKARNDSRYDKEFFSKTEFGLLFLQDNNPNALKNSLSNHDKLSTMGSDNEFENLSGNYANQPSEYSSNNRKRCSYCNGTGRCPTCSKVFSMSYYDENGGMWKNRNETKPGYVRCESCFGKGYRGGGSNLQGPQPKEKCYNNCMNGWLYCSECNSSGNGEHIGECQHCRGSGISN